MAESHGEAAVAAGERAARYPLLAIEWEDTTNIAAWQEREEAVEWAQAGGWYVTNVGYLIHADADCYVLAARITEDRAHVGLTERIPRRAVLRVAVLVEGPPESVTAWGWL